MIAATPKRKRRRGPLPPAGTGLALHLPPARRLRWLYAVLGAALLAIFALVFWGDGRLGIHGTEAPEPIVDIVEQAAPPPPPPSPPPPPPPEPIKPLPPPEKIPETPPTPPQFGMEKDETSEAGNLAVATGNSLMVKADTVVKPPPAPVRIDQEPEALDKVLPEYPKEAEEQGLTSQVILLVTTDAQGRVVDARVQTSGGGDFDAAALAAARKTRYKPYIREGRQQAARFTVKYAFVME
jgi:periplasmic protein TonB